MDGRYIHFRVRGQPVTQGSMRARKTSDGRAFVVADKPKDLTEWRRAVADEARRAVGDGLVIDEPVSISLTFWLPRPKSRPKKDVFPDRKPDLDKLVRAVLDALGKDAAVLAEDSRVVRVNALKLYAPADGIPGVDVTLERV